MNNILRQQVRLRNEITLEVEETLYTIVYSEADHYLGLTWFYLESEFGDENTEVETKIINGQPQTIKYAKMSNSQDPFLVA